MKYGYLSDVSNVDFSLPESPDFQKDLLSLPKSEKLNFFVGSSVWADKDFKGHFYPEKTPQKNFLLEYGKQFNTVEVNATRYGTPKESTLETWKNSVPDSFRFSFKMPQIISVRKNLLEADVLNRLEEFVLAMDKMGEKAGTTFILLQNNFSNERLEELNRFLSYLPHEQQFAVEIRNSNFNKSIELNQILNQNNVANVITDTAGEREGFLQNAAAYNRIAIKLKTHNQKKSVMGECQEQFYNEEMMNKMDENKQLLGFENGVYDFKQKCFRQGLPEDYISFTTKTNYMPFDETNEEHITIKEEIDDFMEKVFPNEQLREYMWDHAASTLIGENINLKFIIYTGVGGNGKSIWVKIVN